MLSLLLFLACTFGVSLAKSNCYAELGCFPNKYPWYSWMRPILPAVSPKEINTTFAIVTRKNGPSIPITTWPKINVKKLFDAKKPTFIITHGYKSDIKKDWSFKLTRAILSKTKGNIILVNWKKGANYGYLRCLSNIRIVAAEISRLIRYLINHHSADVSSFHLLGHSLGAHVMSYVGKNITGIARITALDPARPGFQGKHPAVRLHTGDAKFIDVLHTDGRPLLGLGMSVSVGNVDFYFNGGTTQPKCSSDGRSFNLKSLLSIPKVTMNLLYNLASCNHGLAPLYLAAAIERCRMWGRPYKRKGKRPRNPSQITPRICTFKMCTVVGLDTPKYPRRGDFVVHTTGSYPYCRA